ncbi:MAG: precorrin-3B synthase [Solirubrobacteraceae bacterium]|nr:precorrin-3B synthase [Solirubrobacteraceae bacterium]
MSFTAPEPRTRRDRCPGLLAMHEAADGWLARVRIPGGRLSGAQLRALGAAAADLGNGLVDITARANLQLRGLGADAAAQLAARLSDAGLLPSQAHDLVRNVLASPLAGRSPDALDGVDDVVALLDAKLCADPALGELPGRFCFLVDDGTGSGTDVRPDITVAARGDGSFAVLLDTQALAFEGDAGAAVEMALGAARSFLEVGGDAWRMSETPGGAGSVARHLGVAIAPARRRPRRAAALDPGPQRQRDGRVAVTGLAPLGQLSPALLLELARLRDDVRLSTRRTVTLVDVDAGAADAVSDELQRCGLEVDGASGWVGLTACAGIGACRSALADVRAAAAQRARVRLPGAPIEHWAACGRRCGEDGDVAVAVAVQGTISVAVRAGTREWTEPTLESARAGLLVEAAG